MEITGNILKLKATFINKNSDVSYQLPLGGELYDCAEWIGKKVTIKFDGLINCIDSGEVITKSYNSGYSYKSFQKLAECDMCMTRPSLCHFAQGTCRDESFAQKHCFKPHVVYLSYTSDFKVGITRQKQVPTRFLDQGALLAKPIFIVKDRLHSGLMEDFLAKYYADKTSWKKMLGSFNQVEKGVVTEFEKNYLRISRLAQLKNLELEGIPYDQEELLHIKYPILPEAYESKLSSYNLDKVGEVQDQLLGIKGQYLIFKGGVLNIRKYQGYHITLKVE
ncbi:DUF2797 domain-containing protein [Bacteriovoracaceae bacterium]|nr:DUF2797 domain-containing protein [Bacteriovoracaceae bacterium]